MIRLSNLGKKFHDRWVFQGAALEIHENESTVIIGPSGSGKSVLLKLIAGLMQPDEGQIKIKSSNIGMLFQKNALFDSLTVEENLLFPLSERQQLSNKKAKEKATRFLNAVGLGGTESLYPDEISGGMQKRLGIARALVMDPEIILYDEPTAGLDPITSKTIAELIKELQTETGSTLLTVTNDMQRAYQLGDQICLLAQQKLLNGGTPEDVKNSNDPSIRQFIYGMRTGPLTAELS